MCSPSIITSAVMALAIVAKDQNQIQKLQERVLLPLFPTNDTIAEAISSALSASEKLSSNGSWTDIDYSDVSSSGRDHWQPETHLDRLMTMTVPLVACQVANNSLCNNSALDLSVNSALNFWLKRNPCSQNWFFNQIAAPGELGIILLLLQYGSRLQQSILNSADIDLRRGADQWRGWSGFNAVSLAKIQIYRGILWKNEALISEGFGAVWSQLTLMIWPPPAPSETRAARCNSSSAADVPCIPDSCQVGGGSYLGDGIQIDGSFHQHGAQLLDGAYGQGLTTAILSFLPMGAGLKWQCPPSNLDILGVLVLQGQRKMALPGPGGSTQLVWDWQVCGRGCVVSGGVSQVSISAANLRFAASLYSPGSSIATGLIDFANDLDGKSFNNAYSVNNAERRSITDPYNLSGVKNNPTFKSTTSFYRSDYLVHKRPGWIATWKGRSNRTIPARCVNGDSKMSADTGEGATFVYRYEERGTAHQGIWPVINWQQFPGITSQQDCLQDCSWTYTYAKSPTFVGSVTDGNYGVAAQILGAHALTARRSWLFSDSAVSSLISKAVLESTPEVSGMKSENVGKVLTTMANQRLFGNVSIKFRNGSTWVLPQGNISYPGSIVEWIHHNHTMYYLTNASDRVIVHIENGLRYGDYWRISMTHKPASGAIFRISAEHTALYSESSRLILSDFSYMVVPNSDPNPVSSDRFSVSESQNAESIINSSASETTHVLLDNNASIAGVVFWEPGHATIPLGSLSPFTRVDIASAKPNDGPDSMRTMEVSSNAPCLLLFRQIEAQLFSIAASNPDISTGLDLLLNVNVPISSVFGSGCSITQTAESNKGFKSLEQVQSISNTLKIELPGAEFMGKSIVCNVTFQQSAA